MLQTLAGSTGVMPGPAALTHALSLPGSAEGVL